MGKLTDFIKEYWTFIKEYWTVILGLLFIAWLFWWALGTVSSPATKEWTARPMQTMTIEDLVILVIIHAWISRSDIKVKK